MKRIIENIYVGTVSDILFAKQSNFSILGACKEPLHRQHAKLQGASEEGYVGRAMDKREPEYLYAERDHALYLNLIDAKDPKYIPDEVINKALDFIDKELDNRKSVLIVCNKAESRSPSIALMWVIKNTTLGLYPYENIIEEFKDVYPAYNPSDGMKQYVKKFWEENKNGK